MVQRPTRISTAMVFIIFFFTACRSQVSNPTPVPTEAPESPTAASAVPTLEATQSQVNTEVPVEELRRTISDTNATIAFNQEFDQLNPLYATVLSAQLVYDIWNCKAWNFDDQNNPFPLLVKEMPSHENGGISADGKEITLQLRDDIVWSDGSPISSQDFLFTYQMIINPNNNVLDVAPYNLLENVTAPDAKTVKVIFKEPNASWIHTLWSVILPAHVLQPVFDQQGSLQNADWNRAPTVGCGPFTFESWEPAASVTFKTNENYWLDYPLIGKIVIRFLPDDAAKADAIIKGEVDISIFLIDGARQVPILAEAGMQILPVDSGYKEGIFFFLDPTNGHPALQDERVRHAITIAIDRPSIINDIYSNSVVPVASYWDSTPYMEPGLQPWTYNLEEAVRLLDETGWVDSDGDGIRDKDGVELILSYGTTTSEVRQSVQTAIQQKLNSIGFFIELSNYDNATFFATSDQGGPAATGQLDIFEYAARTTNYPDPSTSDFECDHIPTAELTQGENWSYLCDQELDQLFKQQVTQIDFEERVQTFHQISKMIFDRIYFVGLWNDPDFWSANPRLKNVKLSAISPFYNISDWVIQQ